MKEQLSEVLIKLFAKKPEDVAALFNEDQLSESATATILGWGAAKAAEEKAIQGKRFDAGYSKAKAEELTRAENLVRSAFGYEDEAENLEDLVSKVKSKVDESVKTGKKTDDIKTHPDYIALLNDVKKNYVPKTDHEKAINDFESFKKGQERERKVATIREKAIQMVKQAGYVLPEDPTIAETQLKYFVADLISQADDFNVTDTDITFIKGDDVVKNSLGHPVSFDEITGTTASRFFIKQKQTPKGNGGNDPKKDNPPRRWWRWSGWPDRH